MAIEKQGYKQPTIFLPHGGGPCFFMDWTMGPANTWDKMKNWLTQLSHSITTTPKAIVIISAHWESNIVTINNANQPPLLYDYSGFPAHTYKLKYPAPGSPLLAEKIQTLLSDAGINNNMNTERGFDHGVFIPLLLTYPEANIPIVQISLNASLDPATHIKIGHALKPLRYDGILIVGSGMSYHNMHKLMRPDDINIESDKFDEWLTKTCMLTATERNEQLCQWSNAPSALDAHPREEHLLPLMVVAGAAGDDLGVNVFTDRVLGATVSAYQFG